MSSQYNSDPHHKQEKRCPACLQTYPPTLEFWYRDKSKRDGLHVWCKSCVIVKSKRWQQDHPERVNIINNRYYEKHIEKIREKDKQRIQDNPELSKEKARRWRQQNPKKHSANQKHRHARKKGADGKHTLEEIKMLYQEQGGKCFHCNEEFNGIYTEDHWIPLARGGSDYIDNIRLLCKSCNSSKGAKLPNEWCPDRYMD